MEEDEEEVKFEFFPFSLGPKWRKNYSFLLSLRDDLFWAMDCRAAVAKRSCEQVCLYLFSFIVCNYKYALVLLSHVEMIGIGKESPKNPSVTCTTHLLG